MPYHPSDPAEVIEKIPDALRGAEGKAYSELRTLVETQPENREAALRFVTTSIEKGRRLNDPRFFGYAEAILTKQLARTPSDPEFITLRAIVKQRRHDFAGAREDLEKVLKRNPSDAQAWVTLATVQIVTGDATGAKQSCMHLLSRTSALTMTACLSLVSSMTGGSEKSYSTLDGELTKAEAQNSANQGETLWALSILGEIAERLGKDAEAEARYKKALSLDSEDSFSISEYADFLLAHNRATEALEILRGREAADNLLLRLVIAEQETKRPELAQHLEVMKGRFDAEERRGESIHARERAMFEREVLKNKPQALEFAKKNWAVQKESLDLLIFAKAAADAHDKEALQTIRDWMKQTGWEDVRVAKILGENGG